MIPDACCGLCRSSTGICLTRFACDHHRDAQRKQDSIDNRGPAHRDPTGEAAIRNVMRSSKRKRREG